MKYRILFTIKNIQDSLQIQFSFSLNFNYVNAQVSLSSWKTCSSALAVFSTNAFQARIIFLQLGHVIVHRRNELSI